MSGVINQSADATTYVSTKKTLLYKATNVVNGKIYIGITSKSLNARRSNHFACAKANAPYKISKAIRKYGASSFHFSVLAVFPNYESALQAEIAAISVFKPEYNTTAGGEGALGYRHPPETIARIAAAHRGKPGPLLGKKRLPETVQKMRLARLANPIKYWLGKYRSEETKLKIKAKKQGCKAPPPTILMQENRARICRTAAAKRRKPVICLSDGSVFESACAASQHYNLERSAVASVCNGRRKQCYGMEFRYL